MSADTMDGRTAAEATGHVTDADLEAGFAHVLASPGDGGTLEMVVRRPGVNRREAIDEGRLTLEAGLEGDSWLARGGYGTPDGAADPDAQLTLTNSRFSALIAGNRERWALAGDQLYVDLDLSLDNLPPGSRLRIGGAVIEVTAVPHNRMQQVPAAFRPAGASVHRHA